MPIPEPPQLVWDDPGEQPAPQVSAMTRDEAIDLARKHLRAAAGKNYRRFRDPPPDWIIDAILEARGAAPRAEQSAAPQGEVEREAFEAHVRSLGRGHQLEPHPKFPGYKSDTMQTYWCGWQARAAIASATPPADSADSLGASPAVAADKLSDFWRSAFPDGMTAEQVCAELADYHFLLEQVPKVYDAVTGGLLTKTNYEASTIIAAFEDHLNERVEEAVQEAIEESEGSTPPEPVPQAEALTDAERLDAFVANPGWELSKTNDPDAEADELWQVHRVSGGRNDREWTLIGAGPTPRAAIDASIRASKGGEHG